MMTALSSISQGALLTSLSVESMNKYAKLVGQTITPTYKSFLGASAAMGGMLGSATTVFYQKRLGTIVSTRILSMCVVFFLVLTIIPVHLVFLVFCRALTSTTIASQFMLMPKFINDNTIMKYKTLVQTVFSINLNVGIVVGYLLNLTPYWASTNCFILSSNILTFISTFFIKLKASEKTNVQIADKDLEAAQPTAEQKVEYTVQEIIQQVAVKFPIWRLVIVTITLSAAQLTTGINSILAYASQILASSFPNNSSLGAIVIGVVKIIATISAMPIINRLRRKILLAIGLYGCVVSNFILIFAFKYDISWLQITVVIMFIIFYQIGPGPIVLMLWGEIFPQNFGPKLTSLAFTVNWVVNISVTLVFPLYPQVWTAYCVYFIFTGFFGTVALILLPETFQRTAEEIEKQYIPKINHRTDKA
eukprot:EST45421.1 Hexose transporter [Spironucleus salmonicida]